MKKINKLLIAVFAVLTTMSAGAFAQQITKFAVVDTSKVYSAYYKNSAPVRNYEKKKAEFQAEINRRTEELRNLKQKKVEYDKNGDDAAAQRTAAEITRKVEYLNEYTNAKNVELETMFANLKSSDEFYKKLYKTLGRVAESGGYSMILSLQESNAILWYSPSVDVTDDVISELGL
ncbi:MAG: OmpH family outer membrane protein [Treponema sp.]|nr:OmpH family outer membrane protein [Treponema sp.]